MITPNDVDECTAALYQRVAQECAQEDGGRIADIVWSGIVARARCELERAETGTTDFAELLNAAVVGDPVACATQKWLSIADGAHLAAWVSTNWESISSRVRLLMQTKEADPSSGVSTDPERRAHVRAALEIAADNDPNIAHVVWCGVVAEARWRWSRSSDRASCEPERFITEAVFGDPVRLSARDALHCPACSGALATWISARWETVCARANELIAVSSLDPDAET